MSKNLIIPERIQVETVFGCNASCIMCPVNMPTKRKKGVMSLELFKKIVDEIEPYKNHIKKFDLWGLGAPLLDNTLFEKIKYAKSKGFGSLAIATNANLLDEKKQDKILESGLDAVIFSIDGTKKETHESIRKGVNFDRVVKNAKSIIEKRDRGNYRTRFVFRFIRQDLNKNQWAEFKKFWGSLISKEKGDKIIGYDMHSWGGELPLSKINQKNHEIALKPCHHVFDRLMILWDGTVPLCCSDLHHANYSLGNVKDSLPIEIFNNEKITNIRKIHLAHKKNSMKICKECTILYSEMHQEIE